ncbi:hypothetical protein QQ045_031206 [Rhodiola kirilowii]
MVHDDFNYRPYEEELMERLHPVCLELRELWAADVPLICFNIIEWHLPIRAMRQCGWKQIIPPAPIAFMNEHHGLERKKKVDCRVHLCQYGELWTTRWERLIFGDPGEMARTLIFPVMNMCIGDDDDMSVDDDHVTNLDSQTPCYDRPSSSRAPPSQPSRPSTSQAPHSLPGHGHVLRLEKTPKQSWLQKLRQKTFARD